MTRYAQTQLLLGTFTAGAGFSTVACIRSGLPWHALFCTAVGVVIVGAASSSRDAHHLARRRAEAAERLARPYDNGTGTFLACCTPWAETQSVHAASCPAGRDAAMLALDSSCCEGWWTSLGAAHTVHCPTRARKDRAA